MDVDSYFDRVIVYDGRLSIQERDEIIDDILFRNLDLPIDKPFKREHLELFGDKALVLYISDVYELLAISYFLTHSGEASPYMLRILK